MLQPETSPHGPAFGPDNTPYTAIGGDAAVRALVDTFYDYMDREPAFATIRALHPPDLATSREKLYEFLSGWLGGPQLYIEKYGHPRLRGRHMPFPIGETERDQWLACMKLALDERNITGDIRTFLDSRFAHVADFMRNR
ncbi:MAG TPA: group II truncated hemoglobin [Phycisphaerales bacterium]|nr:group II truncated hemoglobin [Phycisphaerales bacterium]HRQ75810.1 group II truncated hemoglobin [Phycisphaerales bacterium]